MNKYQEALEFFRKVSNRVPLKSATDKFCEEYDNNFSVIEDLVFKNKRLKPAKKQVKDEWCRTVTKYDCPICGYTFERTFDYCPECGQAIDWRENET